MYIQINSGETFKRKRSGKRDNCRYIIIIIHNYNNIGLGLDSAIIAQFVEHCPEYRVSWVRIPPEVTLRFHLTIASGVFLSFSLSFFLHLR